MKKILFVTALLFSVQAVPVLANAQEAGAPKEKKEKSLNGDLDGDGMISKAEYLERAKERFDEIDLNKDGKISTAETRAAHQKRKAEMQYRKEQNKLNQEYRDKRLDQEKKKLERLGNSITR